MVGDDYVDIDDTAINTGHFISLNDVPNVHVYVYRVGPFTKPHRMEIQRNVGERRAKNMSHSLHLPLPAHSTQIKEKQILEGSLLQCVCALVLVCFFFAIVAK